MPTFQVRNRATKMVLGEVTVEDPTKVLEQLREATGSSIEDIALALGSTLEEAEAALDIVVVRGSPPQQRRVRKAEVASLPRRQLFG